MYTEYNAGFKNASSRHNFEKFKVKIEIGIVFSIKFVVLLLIINVIITNMYIYKILLCNVCTIFS